jgi:outer membrane protein assembly factor BamB
MLSAGCLVFLTGNATVALDVASGKVRWSLPVVGARTVYDGRVYMIGAEQRYVVADLRSGEVLLDVRLGDRLLRAAGEPVECGSRLAVSDTHVFFGDLRGRVWAIERESGKPVWFDRPPGAQMFLGVIPVISDGRLYIGSTVLPPQKGPTYLYCYEEAEGLTAVSARSAAAKPEQKATAVPEKAGTRRAVPSGKRATSASAKARKAAAKPKAKKRA